MDMRVWFPKQRPCKCAQKGGREVEEEVDEDPDALALMGFGGFGGSRK